MTGDLFPETRVDPTVDLDRRYTTRETMKLCMELAQVDAWDLDVAADEESHHGRAWYTRQDDGLTRTWFDRVWCNPPYSDIEPWVRKAWAEFERRTGPRVVAMLLPANRTEQPWWQELVEPFRDRLPDAVLHTYHLPGRVRFGHPGNPQGLGVGSPPFGCVLLVWRRA